MFFFNEIIINNYRPSDVESEVYFFRIRGKAKKEQICAVLFCFVMKKIAAQFYRSTGLVDHNFELCEAEFVLRAVNNSLVPGPALNMDHLAHVGLLHLNLNGHER